MKIENEVRKHHRSGFLRSLFSRLFRPRLGCLGKGVVIDSDVRFLRFPKQVHLADYVLVKEGVRICPANENAVIEVGANTTIGYHTFMFSHAGIHIGENCLIAPFCYLVDNNHGIHKEELIRKQSMTAAPIQIGADVWLGVGVRVLKGVQIGRGAVIGAGCVISRDVPEYAILQQAQCEIQGYREIRNGR